MNLVSSHGKRFGHWVATPKLICTQAEHKTVKKRIEQITDILGANMAIFEELGLYNEAYNLFDKLCDIEIAEEELGD